MTFMFPDEQTPPLNKATIDHVVKTVMKYADAQFNKALQARGHVLTKFRLSRALGALTAIKPFIGVNPQFDRLMADCNELWKNAITADYDEETDYLWGNPHDLLDF